MGYAGLAFVQLEKAARDQPDNYEIQKALGKVYFKLGMLALERDTGEAINFLQQSRNSYLAASSLNPLDVSSAYGIARAEAQLVELYTSLYPGSKGHYSYYPDTYFDKALRLRPNSVFYRYAYARYLSHIGNNKKLVSVIRDLARVYPPSYYYLQDEAFWSPEIKEACKKGIEEAIKDNILPREAHLALSSMLAKDKQWTAAISQYKKALTYRAFDNKAENYIDLGDLYLKNGQFKEAHTCFFHALRIGREKDEILQQIFYLYEDHHLLEEFEQFYRDADETFILPPHSKMILAQTLIELKQFYQAQRILSESIQKRPDAEAYYWLARAFQGKKDWDGMELAIQKATVLDPENSEYYLLFSEALQQKGKLERAEKAANLAIQYWKEPSPWYLDNRAWIKWERKEK